MKKEVIVTFILELVRRIFKLFRKTNPKVEHAAEEAKKGNIDAVNDIYNKPDSK